MDPQTRQQISNMILNLHDGDRASADKLLKHVMENKVRQIFDREYEKVKTSFSTKR